MTNEQVESIVRVVLEISKAHWLKHGTPIKPEDAPLVAGDVLGRLPPEPKAPQAPIARVIVNEKGWCVGASVYAPGLPPGEHELYCEPEAVAPCLRAERTTGD